MATFVDPSPCIEFSTPGGICISCIEDGRLRTDCTKTQSCCGWFCPGDPDVPQYINVTDPIYGSFKLNLVKSKGVCSYNLDTYFPFAGQGSCSEGLVPVNLNINGNGIFRISFNETTSAYCGNLGNNPPQTNCQDSRGVCPGDAMYITCPTYDQTFPVPILVSCQNEVLLTIPCNTNTPFYASVQAYPPSPYCQGNSTRITNTGYLMYNSCPYDGLTRLTWTFEGGPTDRIGCLGCCNTDCDPCYIPQKDLTLNYTNIISGNGSTTLSYNSKTLTWESDCVNGLTYQLLCTSGEVELRVIYYTTGACPNGTQQYCSNLRTNPYGLILSSYGCDPFDLIFVCHSNTCPTITNSGYTKFEVVDTSPAPDEPGLMCQNICVNSCAGNITQGVDIDVAVLLDGTTVASGTVHGPGNCTWLSWVGEADTYTLQVSVDDTQCYSEEFYMSCSGTTQAEVGATCLCGPPPATIEATITYVYSGDGFVSPPYSCTKTVPEYTPNSALYVWYFACGPLLFPFLFSIDPCELILGGEPIICVDETGFPNNSSCDPLNMTYVLYLPGCPLFGEIPPTVNATLVLTS